MMIGAEASRAAAGVAHARASFVPADSQEEDRRKPRRGWMSSGIRTTGLEHGERGLFPAREFQTSGECVGGEIT